MSGLIVIGKVVASVLLLIFFLAGALKANPRTHNPDYPPMAEYTAGFLICGFSVFVLHYLWS